MIFTAPLFKRPKKTVCKRMDRTEGLPGMDWLTTKSVGKVTPSADVFSPAILIFTLVSELEVVSKWGRFQTIFERPLFGDCVCIYI